MAVTSPNDVLYFCDESSQITDSFAAVAGLAVRRRNIHKIITDLNAIKAASGKTGEVKWKNAKSYGGRAHRGYIDYLFLLIAERKAEFHIRFSPMSDYDHRLSGERRKVDTVSKAFFQLLLHRAYRCYKTSPVFIYPDDGEYTAELPGQIGALNYRGCEKFGGMPFGCVQEIVPRASSSEPMLQLLDVTLGGLATIKNGRHLTPSYSGTKRDLAEYALAKTGWATLTGNSAYGRYNLNRWDVKPSIVK